MNKQPLVSIIIPIFKVEQYLRPCVDSVINQTYKNLEIILVDDGSPDKCPEICDDYATKDQRIKVIHKRNGGLSDARNSGIEMANGNYLSFVDSDDIIHNQMIEMLMKPLLEDVDLKISACQLVRFSEDIIIPYCEVIHFSTIDYNEFLTKPLYMVAVGKVYKKNLFNDIKYPIGRVHEDEFTTYKICYLAKKIAYTESQFYFYRQREGSIMTTMTINRFVDIHDALKGQVDFFLEHHENQMYYQFLIRYVLAYNNRKHLKKTLEGSKNILALWKTDLEKYPLHCLTFRQKINFIMYFRFPRFRELLSKLVKKK